MATAKQRAWRKKFAAMFGGRKTQKTRRRRVGGFMARRKSARRSSGGFGRSDFIGSALEGLAVSNLSRRFGAPQLIGQYSGAGYAAIYSMVRKKNMIAAVGAPLVLDGLLGANSGSTSGGNWNF